MQHKHIISVCVCTYRRPKQLARLLDELDGQDSENRFSYSIIIVDNDKYESARDTVESHINRTHIPVSYHVEPRQNIALARNMAIEKANGDFVAFIDDDEIPGSRWLLKLYEAITSNNADGVLGPVLPLFNIRPPKWVLQGRLFERPSHASGEALNWKNTRTGNVLMRSGLFADNNDRFRPSLGSGGEDRDFFKRKITGGGVFIWCNEAPVYETVPQKRWEKKTLVKRALLRGKMAFNSSESKPISILISLFAIAVYTSGLPFLFITSPLIGFATFMKYLIKDFDHLGKILAVLKIEIVREKYIS